MVHLGIVKSKRVKTNVNHTSDLTQNIYYIHILRVLKHNAKQCQIKGLVGSSLERLA